jgi:polyisoprenoid-binding protein YceI
MKTPTLLLTKEDITKKVRLLFFIFCLTAIFGYEALSATTLPEGKLKVESGKMHFTLVKTSSSGYDPEMTEFSSMTGLANDLTGYVNLKDKTFDMTLNVSLDSFSLSGKFKFANNRMHETHLESFKFSTTNYKGTIVSYDPATGLAKVTGKLTVHGVTKDNVTIEGKVTPSKVTKGNFLLTADFKVNLKDFSIEVPNTKLTKVSEIVKLKIKIELKSEK